MAKSFENYTNIDFHKDRCFSVLYLFVRCYFGLLKVKGQGSFIRHILNYTEYNQ